MVWFCLEEELIEKSPWQGLVLPCDVIQNWDNCMCKISAVRSLSDLQIETVLWKLVLDRRCAGMVCYFAMLFCNVIFRRCCAMLFCHVVLKCCFAMWFCDVVLQCCSSTLFCNVVFQETLAVCLQRAGQKVEIFSQSIWPVLILSKMCCWYADT